MFTITKLSLVLGILIYAIDVYVSAMLATATIRVSIRNAAMMHDVLIDVYNETLGSGGQGSVLAAIEKEYGIKLVAKLESSSNAGEIDHEYKVLEDLGCVRNPRCLDIGLPEVLSFGVIGNKKTILMTRFGSDFLTMAHNNNGTVGWNIIRVAVCQWLDTLEYMGSKGYAHLDLKPENLALGLYRPDEIFDGAPVGMSSTSKAYIFDLGNARKFRDGNIVFPQMRVDSPQGTAIYSAADANELKSQGPREDLQSLAIVAMALLTGFVPWWNEKSFSKLAEAKRRLNIPAYLAKMNNESDMVQAVAAFEMYYDLLKVQQFMETPNYRNYKNCFDLNNIQIRIQGFANRKPPFSVRKMFRKLYLKFRNGIKKI